MEKVETYEEAKVIIKSSTTSEIAEHNKKALKLRAGFITLIAIAATSVTGIAVGDSSASMAVMPIFGSISISSIIPYLLYLRNQRKIEDDSFFKNKSEEEIIQMANEYAEAYNQYSSHVGEKGK